MSNKVMKNGKVPLAAKGKNISEFYLGAPNSDFDIPADCEAELKELGYEKRWISISKFKQSASRHNAGWKPHKFKCLSGGAGNPFADSTLDGFLTFKDMVLAVLPKDMVAKRREYTKRKTALQANAGKSAVEAFKEFAKDEKAVKVHEGFEDNE